MDWFRAQIVGVMLSIIYNNPLLNFTTIVDAKSGEVRNKFYFAKFIGFKIKLYPHPTKDGCFTRGTIEGSLHYFWNDGQHNYNRFPFLSQIVAARKLVKALGIELYNLRLVQLEIGLNLRINCPVSEILNALRFHRRTPFTDIIKNERGHFKESTQSRLFLKAYDKGLQNTLNDNIFRFEIKTIDLELLRNEYGELTFETLFSFVFRDFKQKLLNRWDECVFVHPEDFKTLAEYYHYHDQQKWLSILQNENKARANENWKTKRRKLDEIISKNPTSKKNLIRNMISQEFDRLFPFNPQMGDLSILPKWVNRICPITHVDISMQKNDSFVLSNSGLKHLIENDPTKFEEIKGKYLGRKFWNEPIQTQINEIAHRIRRCKQSGYELNNHFPREQLTLNL